MLFFIESLAGGGAEKILSIVASHIDKSRFEVTVCALSDGGPHAEAVRRAVSFRPIIRSGRSQRLMSVLIYRVLSPWWICRLFLPRGFDVTVASIEGFATRVAARLPRRQRKIAWVHIDLEANPWTQRDAYRSLAQERRAYGRFDEIVCVSESVRRAFERRFGLPARVIYNPVDVEEIRRLAQTPRHTKPPLPESAQVHLAPRHAAAPRGVTKSSPRRQRSSSALTFVSVGRLVHQKGYDRLIPILGRLAKEGHRFELWIVGEGPDRAMLESLIAEHRLEGVVKLTGWMENPHRKVAAADWFVCSSRSEGYSTVVTEALILGVAVVAVDCAGTRELLGAGGEWGVVVENSDEELERALRKILTQPALTKKYRALARRRGEQFSLDAQMSQIESLLNEGL